MAMAIFATDARMEFAGSVWWIEKYIYLDYKSIWFHLALNKQKFIILL